MSKGKLPDRILRIDNPDKEFHEKWSQGRNMLNIPHPFRAVATGPPNVGKTTVVINILLRADPAFEDVKVIHCDGGYTQEYAEIGAEMLDCIPSPEEWEGELKTLVVLDDLEYKTMNKDTRRCLDRLFGYVSTHKNISLILCSQDTFNIPPIVRRCSNLWIIWKSPDGDNMNNIAKKVGIQPTKFNRIFDKMMPERTDSLWIDKTSGSPYPFRKNGFEVIKKVTDS